MGGLARRLGHHRRRRDRDGEPRGHRRPVHVPALRCRQLRGQQVLGDAARGDLDRRHDVDLLRRNRGLGEDAVVPPRCRDHRALPLRCRRTRQGLRGPAGRLRSAQPELAQPLRHPLDERADGRTARGDLHLLGLGQPRVGERGDGRQGADTGNRGRRQHDSPALDLCVRLVRRAGLRRDAVPDRQLRRRPQRARYRGARLGALHPDHRGAHIGLRFDPDDDPPHHAHVALDGGAPGDPDATSRASTLAT